MAIDHDRIEASSASSNNDIEMRNENEKLSRLDLSHSEGSEAKAPEEMEMGDERESAGLLPEASEKPESKKHPWFGTVLWTSINTLATIGIVFTNKAIFSDPSLKLAQLTFASFHFTITWLTLYILSRPRFAFFQPRRTTVTEILPLSVTMALNVILPNLSLAFSSVTFYQVARILLTPTVAAMNYILYRATLPRAALIALVPACAGVGIVSYYDSLPAADAKVKTTSTLGIIFAFLGIFASSLYTVWIASFHRKLQMSSMQLLFNQAPVSAFLLLYVIPFVDTFPTWSSVQISRWVMILMSGAFASLINISQFFIIAQTGPVSSTVVGHLKTCTIIALGWATSGRSVGDKSVLGVFIAVGGIMAYSYIMIKEKQKAAAQAARA